MTAAEEKNRKIIAAKFFATDTESTGRIFGLDLMRATSILMAMGYHALYFFVIPLPWVYHEGTFAAYWSIELFFVLSGFLIGNMIAKSYVKDTEYRFGHIASFWKRRWIRTLPNYYLMLLVNLLLILIPGIRGEGFSWKFFVFLQGFTTRPPTFFPETWSLAIEEWFYFLMPLILALFHFLFVRKLAKKNVILLMIIFSLALFTVLRVVYCLNVNPSFDWDLRKVVIYQLDGVVYGVMIAWLFRFKPEVFNSTKNYLAIAGMIIVICTYGVLKLRPEDPMIKALWFSFTSLGFSICIPFMYYLKFNAGKLKSIIVHVSVVSYSSSLIYLYMIQQTSLLLFVPTTIISGILNYIFYLLFVVLLSTVMYNYFERPILLLRK